MNDLISVVVPVYNTGTPLKACIDSILSQQYFPLEIILVDDGSTDKVTLSICDEYMREHSSIVLIHQDNGGAAKARNTGIENAHGKYIAFVDSDDVIDQDAYSNLHEAIVRYGVPLVLGNLAIEGTHQSFGDSGLTDGRYNNKTILSKFLQGYWCSACTNLYSTDLIKNIKFPENEINEDYLFNFRVLMQVENIGVITKPFYHYIRREDSVTSKPASLKHMDWIKHTIYIKKEITEKYGEELKEEANFQYLYANIVLSNKCILNMVDGFINEPNELFKICVNNLKKDKKLLLKNSLLGRKYKFFGTCLIFFPYLYKFITSSIIKLLK